MEDDPYATVTDSDSDMDTDVVHTHTWSLRDGTKIVETYDTDGKLHSDGDKCAREILYPARKRTRSSGNPRHVQASSREWAHHGQIHRSGVNKPAVEIMYADFGCQRFYYTHDMCHVATEQHIGQMRHVDFYNNDKATQEEEIYLHLRISDMSSDDITITTSDTTCNVRQRLPIYNFDFIEYQSEECGTPTTRKAWLRYACSWDKNIYTVYGGVNECVFSMIYE